MADDTGTCPNCTKEIRFELRLGGWVHARTGSVWCDGGPAVGSCVRGPVTTDNEPT